MSKLSVPEAAEQLGVSPARVRQRIEDGTLIAEKIGGRWLVDLQATSLAAPTAGRPPAAESVWWSLWTSALTSHMVTTDAEGAGHDTDDAHAADILLRNAVAAAVAGLPLRERMKRADLALASDPEVLRRCIQPDAVFGDLVIELKALSRTSRRRAVDRFSQGVADRNRTFLLGWLRHRASRHMFVAAPDDLSRLRLDDRLVLSGVSHPDSKMEDPSVVEGYLDVDALPAVTADYWLDAPKVGDRSNVFLHAAPFRPASVEPLMLAADLAEHGGPRETLRAHELLDEAIEQLLAPERAP